MPSIPNFLMQFFSLRNFVTKNHVQNLRLNMTKYKKLLQNMTRFMTKIWDQHFHSKNDKSVLIFFHRKWSPFPLWSLFFFGKFIPFWRAGAGKSTLSESELDHSLARLLLAFLLLSDGPPPWCNCFLWHSAVTAEVNDITLPLLTCLSQETCVYFYLPVYHLLFTFHMVTDMHTDYVGIKISCLKIFQMPNIATLRKKYENEKIGEGANQKQEA